jgi:hypothetical protein
MATVILNLKPEVEASLMAQARTSGMDLEDYLLTLVESAAPSYASAQSGDRAEAVRRMIEFGDKHHLSFGEPITRDLLHEDHRF